jgi:hypothetical protein
MVQQLILPLQQRTAALETQLELAQHRLESTARMNAAQSTSTCTTTIAVGQACHLIVTTRDANGALVPFGGLQATVAASSSSGTGSMSSVTDHMNGTYTCDWIATMAGPVTFTTTLHGIVLTEHVCETLVTNVRAPQQLDVSLVLGDPISSPSSLAITWSIADSLPFASTWRVKLNTETESVVVGAHQKMGRIVVPAFATLLTPDVPHVLSVYGLDATLAEPDTAEPNLASITWQYAAAPTHLAIAPTTSMQGRGRLAVSWTDATPLVIPTSLSEDPASTVAIPPPSLFQVSVQAPGLTRIILPPQTAAAPLLFDPAEHGIGGKNVSLVFSVLELAPHNDTLRQFADVARYLWIYTTPYPLTTIILYHDTEEGMQELTDGETLNMYARQKIRLLCRLFSDHAPYFYPGIELHAELKGDAAILVRQPADVNDDGHTFAMRLQTSSSTTTPTTLVVSALAPSTGALVQCQLTLALPSSSSYVPPPTRVTGITLLPMVVHVQVGKAVDLVCSLQPRAASSVDMVVTVSNFCSGSTTTGDTTAPVARLASSYARADGTYGIRILGLIAGASATVTARIGQVYAATLVTVDAIKIQ